MSREFPIVGRLRAHVKSTSSDAESDGTPVNVSAIIAEYFSARTKLGVLVCTRPEVFKAAAVEKVSALEYWGSHLTWFESYITKNGLGGSLSELVSAKAAQSISNILKSAIDERVFGKVSGTDVVNQMFKLQSWRYMKTFSSGNDCAMLPRVPPHVPWERGHRRHQDGRIAERRFEGQVRRGG